MLSNDLHTGQPRSRVDGPEKVTGAARYAAEFDAADLAHGYVLGSAIARGAITRMDTAAAEAVPGVCRIFTHLNRPRTAWFDYNYRDQGAPPGAPFRPLYNEDIKFSGQPIALVVAETFDAARHAASLIKVTYSVEPHETDLESARSDAYEPPSKRSGMAPPKDRGDADAARSAAPIKVGGDYAIAAEYHNPMEPHATTVVYAPDGSLVIHDKTQGVQNSQAYVAAVFSLSSAKVQVVSPFVGGGFGSGLRPQHQLFLAVMASLELKRSVRVELTRRQMFSHVHRAPTINTLTLGSDPEGRLLSLHHDAVAATSRFEDHQEIVVNWSGLLYPVPDAHFGYKLAKLDTYSPGDMRAPGAPLGVFAIETAMDELAHATGVDPVDLRLRNYAERDENQGKTFTSKELKSCFTAGAECFGWSKRTPAPRSMREGRELIGWGFATGVWEAYFMKTSASAALGADGKLRIACATSDIGTGTYTILSQIAADALGLGMEDVVVSLGDSSLPESPLAGGSWTAASAGAAVHAACEKLRGMVFDRARKLPDSPFADAARDDVVFRGAGISYKADPGRRIALADVMAGADAAESEATVGPSLLNYLRYASYTHSAVFVEVRVDEELGVARVTRMVNAVAAGRILNPKTARSQIMGGAVWGIGMALHEEALTDHALGRIMNASLGEYHIPCQTDVCDMDVIFVPEEDDTVSPLGVKGLGEIGVVGVPAAIGNAIFHATGKRIRDLPITIDKILETTAVA